MKEEIKFSLSLVGEEEKPEEEQLKDMTMI
jgi:hypothetical protein